MDVIDPRCGGLDIHKKTVVACLMTREAGQPPARTIRTFSPMTADLLAWVDRLHAAGRTHVAMERTGVYWRPIDNILEGLLTLLSWAGMRPGHDDSGGKRLGGKPRQGHRWLRQA